VGCRSRIGGAQFTDDKKADEEENQEDALG